MGASNCGRVPKEPGIELGKLIQDSSGQSEFSWLVQHVPAVRFSSRSETRKLYSSKKDSVSLNRDAASSRLVLVRSLVSQILAEEVCYRIIAVNFVVEAQHVMTLIFVDHVVYFHTSFAEVFHELR